MSRVAPRMLALAALLLLAVVAARGATSITLQPLHLGMLGETTPPPPQPTQPQQPIQGVSPLTYAVLLLGIVGLVLAVAAVITLLSMIRRHHRVRSLVAPRGNEKYAEGGVGDIGPMVVAGRRALAQLRRREGGPPSDRVVAAWLSLEEAATETGTERQPHETPTEFVGSVLAGHDVSPEALDRLRRLYGRARFGCAGVLTDADADAAGDALDRIIADLEAAR
ncbi:DUF4129 domain-containing protein [Kutzneria chonburiensis]|uniref:DUF4129 domain-containing protein n=1 Tax=Kutzneria chonburiensis TaxID=1483604 RepID=A0ABV6N9A4_9PSEU|nr:DUF4129 domain-containing protein [Kutzneria chonburiensis]